MARKSVKLATSKQGLFYLRHAWYLSRLLEDTDGCYPDAMDYQEKIKKEEEAVKRIVVTEVSVPIIPKRNSLHINGTEAVQQIRGNSNLNRNFENGFQSDVIHRKPKKHFNSRRVASEIQETCKNGDNGRRKTITFSADVHTISD